MSQGFNRPTVLHFLYNWDSLYARLNSHYKTWSYKKKKHKKIKAYSKSVKKEPTVKRCLLIPDLKTIYVIDQAGRVQASYHRTGRVFQSLAMQGKKLLT